MVGPPASRTVRGGVAAGPGSVAGAPSRVVGGGPPSRAAGVCGGSVSEVEGGPSGVGAPRADEESTFADCNRAERERPTAETGGGAGTVARAGKRAAYSSHFRPGSR